MSRSDESQSGSNSGPNKGLSFPLPPHHIGRIIAASIAQTEAAKNRFVFPDPDEVDESEPVYYTEHEKHGLMAADVSSLSRKKNRRKNAGGKGKKGGKGGKGGGKKQLPSAAVVLAEIKKSFAGKGKLRKAGTKGNLQIAEFNGEFLDLAKAKYFQTCYEEMFSYFHLVFLEEVNAAAVSHIASVLGYTGYCCKTNSRGQAVGFLVHSRFKVIGGPTEYTQITGVQGIPDLRPGYELELEDTTTGEKFKVVVVHLKSMIGGAVSTAVIREKQLDILCNQCLPSNFVGIISGDFNFFINKPTYKETTVLTNAGFSLIYPNDTTSTQSMGGRLDGFFVKGFKRKITFYQVRAYFRNPKITRAFSDHGLTNCQMVLCEAKAQEANDPSPGCSTATNGAADPTDTSGEESNTIVEVPMTDGTETGVDSEQTQDNAQNKLPRIKLQNDEAAPTADTSLKGGGARNNIDIKLDGLKTRGSKVKAKNGVATGGHKMLDSAPKQAKKTPARAFKPNAKAKAKPTAKSASKRKK